MIDLFFQYLQFTSDLADEIRPLINPNHCQIFDSVFGSALPSDYLRYSFGQAYPKFKRQFDSATYSKQFNVFEAFHLTFHGRFVLILARF